MSIFNGFKIQTRIQTQGSSQETPDAGATICAPADAAAIVRDLGAPLYRYFLSRMAAPLAEEGVQETFLRLFSSSSYSADQGPMVAFAWGFSMNVQREILRKNPPAFQDAREKHSSADHTMTDVASPWADSPGGSSSNPSNDRLEFSALRQAVCELQEPELSVFQLFLADLSIGEISTHLQMPEGTVKSHLHRGKLKLKQILSRWGYTDES